MLRRFFELVTIEHTVFGLPFAGCALAFAHQRTPLSPARIALAVLAFTCARSAAMAWNRYADRDVDALNPRTAQRPVPRGDVSPRGALLAALVSAALFVGVAGLLGTLPLVLAPVALVILLGYSHVKRFSWASHLVLGLACGGAPIGACIAARGVVDPEAAWLSLGVGTWVAGFDLIYACQDESFDRAHGLHSIPARFGVGTALGASALLHVGSVVALAMAGHAANAGAVYGGAVLVATLLLVIEHVLVTPRDLRLVNKAFFTVNGWLAVLFFCGTAIDLALRTRAGGGAS